MMTRIFVGSLVLVATTALAHGSQPGQQPQQSAEPTPQEIAKGDSIFRGKLAGGTCYTCHQLNARGLPGLAPDLTDAKWLHGDGSLAFIVSTIQKGVPKPKAASAPMLPRGGTNMTDEQVRAVAAYVYSLRSAKK
jgi:mono/diheme cytochrome c family protein